MKKLSIDRWRVGRKEGVLSDGSKTWEDVPEMFEGGRQGSEVRVERRHRFYIEVLFGVCLWEKLDNGAALASPAVLVTGPGQGALDRYGHGE